MEHFLHSMLSPTAAQSQRINDLPGKPEEPFVNAAKPVAPQTRVISRPARHSNGKGAPNPVPAKTFTLFQDRDTDVF